MENHKIVAIKITTEIKCFFLGGPTGITEANVEEYMETLQALATDKATHAVVKQARDILNKTELPIN